MTKVIRAYNTQQLGKNIIMSKSKSLIPKFMLASPAEFYAPARREIDKSIELIESSMRHLERAASYIEQQKTHTDRKSQKYSELDGLELICSSVLEDLDNIASDIADFSADLEDIQHSKV